MWTKLRYLETKDKYGPLVKEKTQVIRDQGIEKLRTVWSEKVNGFDNQAMTA